jgi:hypothetical protein
VTRRREIGLLLVALAAGCVVLEPPRRPEPYARPVAARPAGRPAGPANPSRPAPGGAGEPEEARARILEVARREVGGRFDGDCSGWIRHVMRTAGVELGPLPSARSMSESLHLVSRPVERPRPGDLVFFHDTYDRDGSGRLGQPWTHVALVEEVDGDAATLLHRGGSGIVRIRIDRSRPHDDAANDAVRVRTGHDPRGTRYLAAELFAGWGDVVER